MTELRHILTNISTNQVQHKDISRAFDEVAIELLLHTKIIMPYGCFYLREIEFYFYNKNNYRDPYTHKHPLQRQFGKWYFHRFKSIDSFLNSNRNGIDITFGNEEVGTYGGILLRKIQYIDSNKFIVGINKIVRAFVEKIGKDSFNNLYGQDVFDKNQPVYLEVEKNNSFSPVYKTQRKGLTIKDDENHKKFYSMRLCYYTTEIVQATS